MPAAEQEVGGGEDEGEDGYGEAAGGDEIDAGEAKERGFEERPDGESGGGVEVAGDVPVAALEVADGSVAVPAFVGVLGPVHPGGVVGEVGVEVKGVQDEEDGGEEEQNRLDGLEDSETSWGPADSCVRRVKRNFAVRVQGITEIARKDAKNCAWGW